MSEENKETTETTVQTTEQTGANSTAPEQQAAKPATLDDVLKDPKNQSVFDQRVAKAIATARTKWEEESKLSAEELATRQLSEREKAIAEREAAQDLREFTVDLRGKLQEQGLPLSFAEILASGTTRETCEAVLADIKAEWDKQINEAIKASARQTTPLVSATATGQTSTSDLAEFAREIRKVK
ncbi:MAG: DUF4355 domain-containing protein [Bacillota bacterium]|nr:DUF4355 domain-containing protein [Bacillota bacterium]